MGTFTYRHYITIDFPNIIKDHESVVCLSILIVTRLQVQVNIELTFISNSNTKTFLEN